MGKWFENYHSYSSFPASQSPEYVMHTYIRLPCAKNTQIRVTGICVVTRKTGGKISRPSVRTSPLIGARLATEQKNDSKKFKSHVMYTKYHINEKSSKHDLDVRLAFSSVVNTKSISFAHL